MAEVLTPEVYAEVRARLDRQNAFIDTQRGANGWAVWKEEDCPEECQVTNKEVSAVEVFEFLRDKPTRYFAYVKGFNPKYNRWGGGESGELTTWTGEHLGTITFGRRYVLPNGSARVPVRVQAINGLAYHGTYFESSGDYARLRACKG